MFRLRKKKEVSPIDYSKCVHVFGKWNRRISQDGIDVHEHTCQLCGVVRKEANRLVCPRDT